jgi:membrane associated rhomboid family serine protease
MATCYRHPGRETGVSCSNCGRPICPDCMTPTSVGMRCPECAQDRTQVRTLRSTQTDPVATYVLIALNVMAFVGTLAAGGGLAERGGGGAIEQGALCGRALTPEGGECGTFPVDGSEYWRLLTGGFLHAGILHILFNMYLLYILGQMLEPSIGRSRFLVLYFTSLLGGAFGAVLVQPTSFTVGASGAVFGLMGGAVVAMRARGFDPMASGLPLLIGLNLVISFAVPGISIGGHIGGLVAGAAAAYLLVQVGERPGRTLLGYAGCVVLAVAAVAGSLAVAGGQGLSA